MTHTRHPLVLLVALLPLSLPAAARAQLAGDVRRDVVIDAAIVSYLPDRGLEGYNHHGTGTLTMNYATVKLGLPIGGHLAVVKISPKVTPERVLAVVDIEPEEAKRTLGFEEQTLDLTHLTPTGVRLGTDASGRVFQLNVNVNVRVTDNTPRDFDVDKLELHHWRFPDSPIMVNDVLYVGRLSTGASPVALVDISGVARVEFSLYELTDAKPWGMLNRGVVTITNPEDKTTIQIRNVLNGRNVAMELAGGPYRVWVRWSPPSRTVEQHRQELVEWREELLRRGAPSSAVADLDKQLARPPGPWLITGGIRGLEPGERVNRRPSPR